MFLDVIVAGGNVRWHFVKFIFLALYLVRIIGIFIYLFQVLIVRILILLSSLLVQIWEEFCFVRFKGFVVLRPLKSQLEMRWIHPSYLFFNFGLDLLGCRTLFLCNFWIFLCKMLDWVFSIINVSQLSFNFILLRFPYRVSLCKVDFFA